MAAASPNDIARRALKRTGFYALKEKAAAPYTPIGSNLLLQSAAEDEVLLSGPAGTGKSRACLEKVHAAMLVYPGARGLIVRKTRASLSQSALKTFEEHVLGNSHPMLLGAPQREFRHAYHYENGSEIVVGGLDKPTRLMSTEFDVIFVQEAIELTLEDWESLTTRARNGRMPFNQIIADTNPSFPRHWLKLRCDDGLTRLIPCTHEDNPVLYANGDWTERGAMYMGKLDRLTGARRLRLRFGKWVQSEGAVYEEFDDQVHVIDRFDIPPDWKRYRSIDFGYTNPFVCDWWAEDPDGRMYLYRQLYRVQRLVTDHAKDIYRYEADLDTEALSDLERDYPKDEDLFRELKVRAAAKERFEFSVADHDAEDRATLERAGIGTIPARKDITTGIEAVQLRFRVAGDGKPRIFFFRDALVEQDPLLAEALRPLSTIDEMPGYAWPKGADGKPVKELPVKLDDHGMDTMRYMVNAIDHKPALPGFLENW